MAKLIGSKAITKHIGYSESTLMEWILNQSFPAKKVNGEWMAETGLVDKFMKARDEPAAADDSRGGDRAPAIRKTSKRKQVKPKQEKRRGRHLTK